MWPSPELEKEETTTTKEEFGGSAGRLPGVTRVLVSIHSLTIQAGSSMSG